MLSTFEVPALEGRVCYLTENEEHQHPTVECYYRNLAFRFDVPASFQLRVGDWLRFSGIVRHDIRIKRNGELAAKPVYYHEPHDNSNRKHWMFFELRDVRYGKIPPPDITESLSETISNLEHLIQYWSYDDNTECIRDNVETLRRSLDLMEKHLRFKIAEEEDRSARVTIPEINLS